MAQTKKKKLDHMFNKLANPAPASSVLVARVAVKRIKEQSTRASTDSGRILLGVQYANSFKAASASFGRNDHSM